MARGGGCQDERCRNSASEVGTDDGTAKKKKKKKKKATKLLRFCFLKRRKENIKADTGEVLVI